MTTKKTTFKCSNCDFTKQVLMHTIPNLPKKKCCAAPLYVIEIMGNHGKKKWLSLGKFMSLKNANIVKFDKEKGINIWEGFEDKPEEKKISKKKDYNIMTRRGQVEEFWDTQPFYYDKSKIFWLWDKEYCRWVVSDEIDFCNSIFQTLNIDTVDIKTRVETIEAFKQVGRLHKPKDIKKSWVQYKEKIYDVKSGDVFDASPEYFVTNPIPWKVGKTENTPTIDKYFGDWMKGQEDSWKDTLYEIIAYNTSPDKFMQRIISLCGGGSNGKGTFIKLNYKFLGEENYVSSEVKSLSEDRFEAAVLFRKLLCVMGEVSYGDLTNTNQLKKLGGEDKISFQFKGKTPFTEDNTATCICLTNSMPSTPDKTQGFYRKWLIIDFLNQFPMIDSSVIDVIPDIEFENLAKKSLRILKQLYKKPHFTNEGDFDERERRYEERSNPVIRFVEEECIESEGNMITLRDLTNYCNNYLKSNSLRILNSKQIGKILREDGFIVGNRKINECSACVILNLRHKTPEEMVKNYPVMDSIPIIKPSLISDSNDSNRGKSKTIKTIITTQIPFHSLTKDSNPILDSNDSNDSNKKDEKKCRKCNKNIGKSDIIDSDGWICRSCLGVGGEK